MRVSAPCLRNGFPFPIVPGELWDGSSWHRVGYAFNPDPTTGANVPYAAASMPGIEGTTEVATDLLGSIYSYTPVVGPSTNYPIGISFKELALWYWRIKKWSMIDADLSGSRVPGPIPSPLPPIYANRTEFETDLISRNFLEFSAGINGFFEDPPEVARLYTEEYLFIQLFGYGGSSSSSLAVEYSSVDPIAVKVGDLYYPGLNFDFVWSGTQTAQIQLTDLGTGTTGYPPGTITFYGGADEGVDPIDGGRRGATTSLAYNEDTHTFTLSAASGFRTDIPDDPIAQSGTIHPFKYYKYDGPGGSIYDEDTGIRV